MTRTYVRTRFGWRWIGGDRTAVSLRLAFVAVPGTEQSDLADRMVRMAAELLAQEGPAALTARRLAREVGTSTMAVYTHFGGMDQVRVAVRKSAFGGLMQTLKRVGPSEDPVADVAEIGLWYCGYARANPHLYRATFLEAGIEHDDIAAGIDAFAPLVEAVQRCLDAGRFSPGPAVPIATQLWTAVHGAATLHLAGMPFETLVQTLAALGRTIFVGLGDEPERAERSVAAGSERWSGRLADDPL
jgi:AcrR family transcriptional regulator